MDETLERLRAANPVPGRPSADDPELFELFERIVASPHEPRRQPSARRRLPARRPRVIIALAILGVGVLGSSAFAISNLLDGHVVRPPVTRSEYRQAQTQLALPPGYHWPALHVPSNSVTTVGGGGGRAVAFAQNAWECFWVDAIRHRDVSAQRRAQAELRNLTTHHVVEAPAGAPEDWAPNPPPPGPYAVFAHDGGLAWIREGYRQAAAGNPERLIASCRANGPG